MELKEFMQQRLPRGAAQHVVRSLGHFFKVVQVHRWPEPNGSIDDRAVQLAMHRCTPEVQRVEAASITGTMRALQWTGKKVKGGAFWGILGDVVVPPKTQAATRACLQYTEVEGLDGVVAKHLQQLCAEQADRAVGALPDLDPQFKIAFVVRVAVGSLLEAYIGRLLANDPSYSRYEQAVELLPYAIPTGFNFREPETLLYVRA